MQKIALALQASKLPIFQMFLLVRKEWADVTPIKSGDCRVKFWDDSSFILRKDGGIDFEYVIEHIKYVHITPLCFVEKTKADAVKKYLDCFSWMKENDLKVSLLSY